MSIDAGPLLSSDTVRNVVVAELIEDLDAVMVKANVIRAMSDFTTPELVMWAKAIAVHAYQDKGALLQALIEEGGDEQTSESH